MKAIKLLGVASFIAALTLVGTGVLAQAPVDADRKAAVRELLDAMNFKQMISQMAGAMSQSMPQMIDQMIDGVAAGGKLTPEQRAEARALASSAKENTSRQMAELFNDPQVVQGMEDITARVYAKHFSMSEIKAIAAFYTSPAGKKMLTVMPQVMQETMPELMAVMQPKMMAMMEKTAREIVAKAGKNTQSKDAAASK